jgi:hypothetical protein
MIVVRNPRPTGMLPNLEKIRLALASRTFVNHPEQANVTPFQLCRWCEGVVAQMGLALSKLKSQPPGEEPSRTQLKHYPSLEELISEASQGCHLCCMLLGSLRHPVKDMLVTKQSLEDYGNLIHARITHWDFSSRYNKHDRYEIDIGQIGIDSSEFDPLVNPLELIAKRKSTKLIRDAQISRHTGSKSCYAMIRNWIHTCTSQHQSCNASEPKQRPSRLLDLEFDNTNDVKLVTGNSSAMSYATLSYSWGSVEQLMLLRTNLMDFMQRIPFADLSNVAQDVVKVCRGLSIRYLWIDALCIIQGEDGDFEQEAPRMNDIYGGCIINITAAQSLDTTQHFLCDREPLQYMDCELSTVELNGCEASITNRHVCQLTSTRNRPGDYNIDSRAWFYQERFLSQRSVYFGTKGIHWECREGMACEAQGNIRVDGIHYKSCNGEFNDVAWNLKSQFAQVASLDHALRSPEAVTALREAWACILESYVDMKLTRPTDRLLAIAGIASVFEKTFGLQAIFGLWINFLNEDLLWTVNPNTRRYAQPQWQAPSWSWANLEDCSVTPSRALRLSEKFGMHTCLEVDSAPIVRLPKQTGFLNLVPIDDRNKALCLRGKLAPCILQVQDKEYSLTPKHKAFAPIDDLPGNIRSEFFEPDCFFSFDPDDADNVFCLLIRTEKHFVSDTNLAHHYVQYYGLVLVPIERIEGPFKGQGTGRRFIRIGIYSESYGNLKEGDTYFNPNCPVQPETMYLWKAAGDAQDVVIV